MLAEVGWDHVPQTYEDLVACCDALLAAGKIPFGCAGKETWCVTEYLEPIIIKSIGYEALNKIFAGEATWNDPDIAKSVDVLQEMINKGYFDPAGAALGNDETKANFLAGKTMDFVRDRAMEGTLLAHTEGGVPNVIVEVDGRDARSLGQMIYFFEFACGLSGYLLEVNPFDQPGVEAYKKNMFALLGKPGYEERRAELEAKLGG